MRFAVLLAALVPFLSAQSKLEPRQRDVIARQETAVGNLERALAKGNASLTTVANWKASLASLQAELDRAKVPAGHPDRAALDARIATFTEQMTAAEETAATAAWARVEQTFADVEQKLGKLQRESELRPLHKRLDEIAAFAATRPGDERSQAAAGRIAALKARGEQWVGDQAASAQQLATLTDPKSYPSLERDFAELDGVFDRYQGFTDVKADPARTAAMCNGWKPAAEYHAHCLDTYRGLLGTDCQLGKDVKARIQRVGEVLIAFRDKAVEFQQATGPAVREALAKAAAMAEQGKAQQKPAFFTGGVRQQLGIAREWLAAYAAIRGDGDQDVVALRSEVEAASRQADEMAATLADRILAETRPPEDVYRGADRAALEQQIRAAWAKKYPGDEVLGVRFPMAAWKRERVSTWYGSSKSWGHTDTSVLCVTFLVRTSETVATSYPAYLNKDHLGGEQITTGVDTKGSGYVSEQMLVANLGAAAAPR